MQLSKRLQAVADFVTRGNITADIGTDHAYIPIFLVSEGISPRAIAMDLKKGPLQKAKEHIREHHLEDYIETRLSDGLGALRPGEAETIVISGMGGAVMKKILTEGREAALKADELILQPQSEIEEFRRFLEREHYTLTAENMVLEEGKYYPMMRAVPGAGKGTGDMPEAGRKGTEDTSNRKETGDMPETDRKGTEPVRTADAAVRKLAAYKYGSLLLAQKHPVLLEYLLWQKSKLEKIWVQLQENAAGRSGEVRKNQIREELDVIAAALSVYEEKNHDL